jgi:hypothetical protein
VETKKELKPREIRAVDFVAELLDEEANKMPPSYKERSESWHKMADAMRQSSNPRTIRVWEEK